MSEISAEQKESATKEIVKLVSSLGKWRESYLQLAGTEETAGIDNQFDYLKDTTKSLREISRRIKTELPESNEFVTEVLQGIDVLDDMTKNLAEMQKLLINRMASNKSMLGDTEFRDQYQRKQAKIRELEAAFNRHIEKGREALKSKTGLVFPERL